MTYIKLQHDAHPKDYTQLVGITVLNWYQLCQI